MILALVTLVSRVTIAMSFTGLRRTAPSLSYLAQSEDSIDTSISQSVGMLLDPLLIPLVDLDPGDVGLGPHPLILPDVILPDPDVNVAPAPAALVEAVRRCQNVLPRCVGIT